MTERTAGDPAAKPNPILLTVEEAVGTELREAEQILLTELQSANPYVRDILQHSTRFRGKRLRPILLLLTADASGGIRHEHKVLSAVVEMIHLATLVHDDVLDDAETRRHVATVNARWNNETSVLFGDYLFTHSFHLAASLGTTHACRMIGRATNIGSKPHFFAPCPDGSGILTCGENNRPVFWKHLSPAQGSVAELRAWVENATGVTLEANDQLSPIDPTELHRRRTAR